MRFVVAMRRSGVNGRPSAANVLCSRGWMPSRTALRCGREQAQEKRWSSALLHGGHCGCLPQPAKRCFSVSALPPSPGTKQAPSSPGPPLPCRSRRTTAWKPTRMIRCWQSSRRILLTLVFCTSFIEERRWCQPRAPAGGEKHSQTEEGQSRSRPGLRVQLPHTRGFS